MFDGLLDARNLDADVVDGEAGDFGDFAVTEGFEQEGDDEAILVGERGDGAAKGGEAFGVLEVLMGGGPGVGDLWEAACAGEEGGVDGDAVERCWWESPRRWARSTGWS